MNKFYAYLHARPNTENASGIFYIGKGSGRRLANIERNNRYHKFIVNKYGKENILIGKLECSDEKTAFDLEKGLIKCFRRMGVKLTNTSDGGEGCSGYRHTDEELKRASEAHMGNKNPMFNRPMKESTRIKRSAISSGKNNPMFGKTHTEEVRKRISEKNKGKKHTQRTLQKMAIARLGAKNPMFGKHRSAEVRKKIADSLRANDSLCNGTIWINKDGIRKRIFPNDLEMMLQSGWVKGWKL